MKNDKKIKIMIEGTIRKAHGEGGGDIPTRVYRIPKRIIQKALKEILNENWIDDDTLSYYLKVDPDKITID